MDINFGFRDVGSAPPSQAMLQSPTGRQLSIDGSFVYTYTTVDPETAYQTAPDGSAWLYESGGHRYIVTFARATGFLKVEVL